MRIMRKLRVWAFTLGLAVSSAVPAIADPQITQTDCEPVAPGSSFIRISFLVSNTGGNGICHFILQPPESADSCRVQGCSAPPGWSCHLNVYGDAIWDSESEFGCVESGQTQGPFALDILPNGCCYTALFFGGAILEPFFSTTVCFECDTQTEPMSWGLLRSLYR